ncbi:MAG TPA: hypothetical protein VNW73_07680, partial [Ktedonobacteraceae bacterium]|nr:hypothetical protein [Ktedonobacteraceae bacterium]
NVRSHSSLAYSSRSPEVFPAFHRETLYHSDQKKTSRLLLMREKQERETSTGNLRGEGALCSACHFLSHGILATCVTHHGSSAKLMIQGCACLGSYY